MRYSVRPGSKENGCKHGTGVRSPPSTRWRSDREPRPTTAWNEFVGACYSGQNRRYLVEGLEDAAADAGFSVLQLDGDLLSAIYSHAPSKTSLRTAMEVRADSHGTLCNQKPSRKIRLRRL